MDPSEPHTAALPTLIQEDDEWDTDGFVIPSLGISEPDQSKSVTSEIENNPSSPKATREETIYLGPHGAPPSQSKQQDLNAVGRKQRFKQILKEADKRNNPTGRENKVENLRELVGGGSAGRAGSGMSKVSPKDWLDPLIAMNLSLRSGSLDDRP